MEEPNCFVAQLAKFFTKNAELLEEMYIDDGEHRISEHLSRKVVRSERRDAQRESGGDCLSKLGDGVLGHILSFLPAFQAAQATVLSRRWRHIFGLVHTISLDRYWKKPRVGVLWPSVPRAGVPATFGDMISAALLGRHRGGVPLRKLHIALRHFHGVTPAMVDQWLSCAMELAGGEYFHLHLRLGGSLACSLGRRRGSFPAAGRLHATCGGEREDDDEEDEDYPVLLLTHNGAAIPRSIPVPTRIFSCVVLRSLRLGPCQLHLPATIDLPCLETLLLTGVVGPGAGAQVQRLVTACPRLADLTLEACAKLTTLSVIDKRLRRLALRCCHGLAAVAADASELRVLEYRGVVPPSFLTMHGPPRISSCTLDLCGEELADPSRLRDFLHLFACAKHLHFKSAQLGFGVGHDVFSCAPAFLTYVALAVPDGVAIPCVTQRVREINLVHYRAAVSQRTLAKFLLRNAPALEELCCAFAPGPLWMQTELMEEMKSWVMNKSTKLMFV
nr:unnamed protein product [Digitaria exilis]